MVVILGLIIMSSPAFAENLNQEIANLLSRNSDAVELIKGFQNSRRLDCSTPGDEETAVNRDAKTFTAEYQCKASELSHATTIVTISGIYTFKSNGELAVQVNGLKINN